MTPFDQLFSTGYDEWESAWAPYDVQTYQAVLDQLLPDDVVLDIGAGDLRLAWQMAAMAKKVYAIETNEQVLGWGLQRYGGKAENLISILADALEVEFPPDVTTGVLLMRHCSHFNVYAKKLKILGCKKLITNARWRMAVETIDLQAPRTNYADVKLGWYACWCGTVGFKTGPAELFSPELDAITHEVIDCPNCSHY